CHWCNDRVSSVYSFFESTAAAGWSAPLFIVCVSSMGENQMGFKPRSIPLFTEI
ncbi:MAG: hypothetical protein ACI9R3_006398, partial [Verrucomicrobiales bacterium]